MVKKSFVVFDIDDDKTDLPTLCSKVEKTFINLPPLCHSALTTKL